MPCCARRLSRRAFEVFFFGTAIAGGNHSGGEPPRIYQGPVRKVAAVDDTRHVVRGKDAGRADLQADRPD